MHGALAFAVSYGLLRLYWATGGRWGFTACERSPEAAGISSGCGAEQLASLPFWQGWGAVALCGALVGVAALPLRRPGRVAAVGAWAACAVLVTMSFPMHLLFQIPAALAGRPTDWRDLANRLLLMAGGVLLGAAAAASAPRGCGHPRTNGPRPMPTWVRQWAYAGVAVPAVGWTVPHGLWVLGVPAGISADELPEIMQNIGLPMAAAVTIVPTLGSLLTLGLARRWGQIFPRWTLWLAGRQVPRALALVPAGTVAVCLIAYGLISTVVMTEELLTGSTTWSDCEKRDNFSAMSTAS